MPQLAFDLTTVMKVAAGVATPLALLAIVAVLVFWYLGKRLDQEKEQLAQLEPAARPEALQGYTNRYGLDANGLGPGQKEDLILKEMEHRAEFRRAALKWSIFAFVACFVVAAGSMVAVAAMNGGGPRRPPLLEVKAAANFDGSIGVVVTLPSKELPVDRRYHVEFAGANGDAIIHRETNVEFDVRGGRAQMVGTIPKAEVDPSRARLVVEDPQGASVEGPWSEFTIRRAP